MQVLELQRRVQGTSYERSLEVRQLFTDQGSPAPWIAPWMGLPFNAITAVQLALYSFSALLASGSHAECAPSQLRSHCRRSFMATS